jgi:hypothetical protein
MPPPGSARGVMQQEKMVRSGCRAAMASTTGNTRGIHGVG